MQGFGFTLDDARDCAHTAGLDISGSDSGTGRGGVARCSFTLKLADRLPDGVLKYQRVSMNGGGRRVSAVCWHGHRDMMRELFRRFPDARLKTALADYHGAADFERTYLSTRGTGNGWNVGYAQACVCAEHDPAVAA